LLVIDLDEDTGVWQFTYTKIADPVIPKCNIFSLEEDSRDCSFNETGKNISNRENYIDEMMKYWSTRSEILKFPNFSKEYALSMYWSSLTLTTKGQQVVDTLIGLLVFAVIVGSVGSVVSTMNRNQTEFQDTLDGIKFYMNYRQVDSDIQKRVLNCCEYIHDQGMSKDEKILLEGLPKRLHGQLAVHLHMATLQHVELLQVLTSALSILK
uniref:Cyclic nucleotide-binding domain-containing protein n=1 Tax=Gongylonema pulchrum TaxID=637853 RepID=A0A183EDR4_9BILA